MKLNVTRLLLLMACTIISATSCVAQEALSFNQDVRPILSKHCFSCHGQDEDHRESGLRLDQREVALEAGAIVPGQPNASALIERVNSLDADEIMPPPHTDRRLTQDQKEVLRRWIAEGAKYQIHWAFEPPKAQPIPKTENHQWPRNPIDSFVLAKLERIHLVPNQEADRYTLVRRLYLDLIGLPPTIEQAEQFVRSEDTKAYEKLVDQLLASPHYGERWAQPWLDLARYSDTNGYEKDRERSIWPYRDWVIRALNNDLPYDQFSIQQLAGDMLPNPSPEQWVATGFHRNTMLNEEGGIDPLEFRFLSMVDRVATTGTVWLGLTTGCAQCHTHKYDPISHLDYYRLMALMNNVEEPDFRIPDPSKQRAIGKANSLIDKLESDFLAQFSTLEENASAVSKGLQANINREFSRWIDESKKGCSKWNIIRPTQMRTNLPKLDVLDDGSIFSSGDITKRDVYELTFDLPQMDEPIDAIRLEAIPDDRLPDQGPGRTYYEGRKGDFFVSEVSATLNGQKIEFMNASHDFSKPDDNNPKTMAMNVFDGDGSTGWQPGKNKGVRLQLIMNLKKPIRSGQLKIELLFERHYTASLGRFRFATTSNSEAIARPVDETVEGILATKTREQWSASEAIAVERAFLLSTSLLAKQRKKINAARGKLPRLNETMVMRERPDNHLRPTFRHHRGEYLSPRETVTAGLPDMFERGLPGSRRPTNRLELAKWLVSDDNPLAARVAVNRAWREMFGTGLIWTNGDFGVQSKPPTHPMLLDWLALQFKDEFKWSKKRLHRLIVTSATYRQASTATSELVLRDPANGLLARGPNFRVSGETVRDIVLQATRTLSTKMYGPGVRPPQPASVTALAYGATKWAPSVGPDRYRRSIYTFKKRTAAFAAYAVFDGPTGETCIARRNRSNTPLQALTVLNDPMYLELARELAKKIDRLEFESREKQVTQIFRCFLTRPPSKFELDSLLDYYQTQIQRMEQGELDPVAIGGDDASRQQAALTMVVRVVINLDETITKR